MTKREPWLDDDDKKLVDNSCYWCVFFEECDERPSTEMVNCEILTDDQLDALNIRRGAEKLMERLRRARARKEQRKAA